MCIYVIKSAMNSYIEGDDVELKNGLNGNTGLAS